jgi:hypothetical protein
MKSEISSNIVNGTLRAFNMGMKRCKNVVQYNEPTTNCNNKSYNAHVNMYFHMSVS